MNGGLHLKLITAIIHGRDKERVGDALLQAGHQFTVIATTGGFMRDGNVTLLIGAEDDAVEEITSVIRECCSSREEFMTAPPYDVMGPGAGLLNPVNVCVGGAIIFVVDVEQFIRV